LTVPDWINAIHELFPQKTIERLEKDALERYHLEEMVTNPDLLSRAQPSETLLKAVLRTKHLMNQQVLAMARDLVRKVVEQLMEKLARKVQSPFTGSLNRQQRSYIKIAKNFDAPTTIRRNLKHYSKQRQQLVIQTPYFNSRMRRQVDRWQLIILVDESGSMLDSVIHSAVTAAIFFGIKSLKTHLCLFDTAVVDVTADCTDPVETLMKVQLGGGTDIGQAMVYAQTLVENPRRTIVILITDFYEGAPVEKLLSVTKQLIESGVTILGLAALDDRANPNYDRAIAQRMVNLGAQVGAMTPGELATWVAEKVR
jgi:Mg-chelatase subunit ChlD